MELPQHNGAVYLGCILQHLSSAPVDQSVAGPDYDAAEADFTVIGTKGAMDVDSMALVPDWPVVDAGAIEPELSCCSSFPTPGMHGVSLAADIVAVDIGAAALSILFCETPNGRVRLNRPLSPLRTCPVAVKLAAHTTPMLLGHQHPCPAAHSLRPFLATSAHSSNFPVVRLACVALVVDSQVVLPSQRQFKNGVPFLKPNHNVPLTYQNRVLLTRRPASMRTFPGCWVAPGGSMDPTDVSLAAAAIRELREETGLLVNPDLGIGS